MSMLDPGRENFTGELRLYIHSKHGKAWIGAVSRRSPDDRINWCIWVHHQPGLPARTCKSPRRLLIESELRSWLLRRYRRCLFTLTFAELCRIAEHESERKRAT
jgi:hypothetical protein